MMQVTRFFSRVAMLFSVVLYAIAILAMPTANAVPAGGGNLNAKGFDTCAAPSTSQMQAWWTNTPWSFVGIYFGGDSRACSQPNLTAAWMNTTYSQGWGYELIWVGPQAPCATFPNTMSYNTTTAYQQGVNEAASEWTALNNLGFGNATNTPVVYDLEAYPSDASCQAAVDAFMRGWATQLAVAPAQVSGVYGSACGSYLQDLASNNPTLKFIVAADWDNNQSTSTLSCITGWTNHQRIKQYIGGHNETWGGVTINIDSNCANAPIATRSNSGTECN